MFYGNTVQDTRQFFFSSWKKYQQQLPLETLEQQIVAVILDHPEYHRILENPQSQLDQTYFPELGQVNPFLHMGLHFTIREQVALDRPSGITKIYQKLLKRHKVPLTVEHLMIDHLAECLWKAQREQAMPDETAYLAALSGL